MAVNVSRSGAFPRKRNGRAWLIRLESVRWRLANRQCAVKLHVREEVGRWKSVSGRAPAWPAGRSRRAGARPAPSGTGKPPRWRYGSALAPLSALATLRGWAGTATVGGALCRKPTKSGPRFEPTGARCRGRPDDPHAKSTVVVHAPLAVLEVDRAAEGLLNSLARSAAAPREVIYYDLVSQRASSD
jgi:hypothetical protein